MERILMLVGGFVVIMLTLAVSINLFVGIKRLVLGIEPEDIAEETANRCADEIAKKWASDLAEEGMEPEPGVREKARADLKEVSRYAIDCYLARTRR